MDTLTSMLSSKRFTYLSDTRCDCTQMESVSRSQPMIHGWDLLIGCVQSQPSVDKQHRALYRGNNPSVSYPCEAGIRNKDL